MPSYRQRVDELHTAGHLVSIHGDGTKRPLLKHPRDCSCDGIEAATLVLQRDVSLEEIMDALGDLILLDGIPALCFLPEQHSAEGLVDCVKGVVDLFHPRLRLGIADAIPPDGDIDRMQFVGDLVQELVW